MSKQRDEMFVTLARLGFTANEARTLLRASATLHTWAEHECNGAIQRDEETDIPYWYNTNTGNKIGRTSDREAGALKRAKAIAATRGFEVYHQGDPRGCALYLYKRADLDKFASRVGSNDRPVSIDSCYNSIGVGVCS